MPSILIDGELRNLPSKQRYVHFPNRCEIVYIEGA